MFISSLLVLYALGAVATFGALVYLDIDTRGGGLPELTFLSRLVVFAALWPVALPIEAWKFWHDSHPLE